LIWNDSTNWEEKNQQLQMRSHKRKNGQKNEIVNIVVGQAA